MFPLFPAHVNETRYYQRVAMAGTRTSDNKDGLRVALRAPLGRQLQS